MGLEIERKFILKNDEWKKEAQEGIAIKQGYLNSHKERTVRIRIKGGKGILTIKGKNEHLTRKEFEYEIPLQDAESLLELCEKPIIEKTRYEYHFEGNIWEIDVFEGVNAGLVVAEIELSGEDQQFDKPDWVGEEVSAVPRYFNSALIAHPYSEWDNSK